MTHERRVDPKSPASARAQPIAFVHEVLRDAALTDPMQFMLAMTLPDAEQKLRNIWQKIGADTPTPVAAEGLALAVDAGAPLSVVLVTLPQPAADGEAYFVAVALAVSSSPPAAAFFTLEHPALLCEWLLDDGAPVHVEHGPLPTPDRASFLRAVGLLLRARGAEAASGIGGGEVV